MKQRHYVAKGATFSEDRQDRYMLERVMSHDNRSTVAFVGLNPSTADHMQDDPTIRRCVGFAERWGYGRIVMLNLFSYRATDPEVMLAHKENTHTVNRNIDVIVEETRAAHLVVAAWGKLGSFQNRDQLILPLLRHPHYLKLNNDGSPSHPLYLPKTMYPRLYLPEMWRKF